LTPNVQSETPRLSPFFVVALSLKFPPCVLGQLRQVLTRIRWMRLFPSHNWFVSKWAPHRSFCHPLPFLVDGKTYLECLLAMVFTPFSSSTGIVSSTRFRGFFSGRPTLRRGPEHFDSERSQAGMFPQIHRSGVPFHPF